MCRFAHLLCPRSIVTKDIYFDRFNILLLHPNFAITSQLPFKKQFLGVEYLYVIWLRSVCYLLIHVTAYALWSVRIRLPACLLLPIQQSEVDPRERAPGTDPHVTRNSFIFMHYSAKKKPPRELAPPLGNPGTLHL